MGCCELQAKYGAGNRRAEPWGGFNDQFSFQTRREEEPRVRVGSPAGAEPGCLVPEAAAVDVDHMRAPVPYPESNQ